MSSRLFIGIFSSSEQLAQILVQLLSSDRYHLHSIDDASEFVDFVEQHQEEIDCLIVLNEPPYQTLLGTLNRKGILLPTIIVNPESLSTNSPVNLEHTSYLHHGAEIILEWHQLNQITSQVDRAITQFLNLAPSCDLADKTIQKKRSKAEKNQTFLMLQQRRLAEKLKERLGYLGVYYKRNPQDFYRNLSKEKQQEFKQQLLKEYRKIILDYFSENNHKINQAIDRFVNRAFFADISVPQVLEVHMDLMDEFAQQLKLEGRSEEILLDYRLAIIDIIAHLCEMYRRSIPREDIPFELLFRID